jgi:Flp pilus assembly protein TadD
MKSLLQKALIFVAVMALVAAAGWFGRKAYKRFAENRLLTQARQYETKKDWRNTNLCLDRVLQIDPINVEACRMIADLLDSGGSPAALSWRIQLAKLEPNNIANRFLWAKLAIKTGNLKSAAEALAKVDEKNKGTAEYHKIAGAMAWELKQPAEAENQYAEALRLEPEDQANALNLETIRLVSTNEVVANAARLALEQTITNAALRPVALQHLLTTAVGHHDWSRALVYSKEVVGNPKANFSDKINYLQLLRETKSDDYTPWLASLKTEALHSAPDAFALGKWMAETEKPDAALRWLQGLPPGIQTNLPVPLIITDCQIALKDWNGLLAFIGRQDWGEAEFYRLAIESLAQRSLNESAAAENTWRKTLSLTAHRVDRLSRLAQVTQVWGWIPERNAILQKITDEFPKEKWAANQLMEQLYAEGNTIGLQTLLAKIHTADPDDVRVKNNLANILLLRKSELEEADLMAQEVYKTSPDDPFFISTYAYSLCLQKKNSDAVKVLETMKPEYLKIPAIAAYYGVIQAQAGHKEVARDCIARAETAKLLPEEKEMIRLAKASL